MALAPESEYSPTAMQEVELAHEIPESCAEVEPPGSSVLHTNHPPPVHPSVRGRLGPVPAL